MPAPRHWSLLLAAPVALTVVIEPCPPYEEWLPKLMKALPELERDLRWYFAAHPPSPGEVPWTDCHWAESLCQLDLPADTRLLTSGSEGIDLPSEPHAAYVIQMMPGVVWLDDVPEGAMEVEPNVWFEVEGGALFAASLAVALVFPLGAPGCYTPQGFKAPFAACANWAWNELREIPQMTWDQVRAVVLGMNYVATNLYLAVQGLMERTHLPVYAAAKEELQELEDLGFDNLLLDLQLFSWRFIELSGFHREKWMDPAVREFSERVFNDLSFIVQTLASLPVEQPLSIAAPVANPVMPPPDAVSIGGAHVPAIGIHTAGLSPTDCFHAAEWALELRIPHIHVDGKEDCHREVANALQSFPRSLWPFVSVKALGKSGSVDEGQVESILSLYGKDAKTKVNLLVLNAELATVAEARHKIDVALATIGDCNEGAVGDASDFCRWSCYTGSVSGVGNRIVQLFSRKAVLLSHKALGVPFRCSGDPHVVSIALELHTSPAAVLLKYHLQRGHGVLLDVPPDRSELEHAVNSRINLNYAHMERIREMPRLAEEIAGKLEITRASAVDVYGLNANSSFSVPARLAPAVDSAFFEALKAPLESWRTSDCMRADPCPAEATPLAARCLINSYQRGNSSDALKRASPSPAQEVQLSAADVESLSNYRLANLKHDYERAAPTRYAVIDDFLPEDVAAALDQELPARDLCTMLRLCAENAEKALHRLQCHLKPDSAAEFLVFNAEIQKTSVAQAVHRLMQSERVISFLHHLTGYEMTPASGSYFEYHAPAYLSIHEDMSKTGAGHKEHGFDPRKADDRVFRLNALFFLDGVQDDSGHLELWGSAPDSNVPSQPVVRIAPRQNRMVLWDTLGVLHGMPWPLKGNQTRRALQWYYTQAKDDRSAVVPSIRFHSLPCADRALCYENAKLI